MNDKSLAVFENYNIRRIYDDESETWYFSVVDIIQALIQQPDYQTARKYWNKLKERLKISLVHIGSSFTVLIATNRNMCMRKGSERFASIG